MMDDISTLPVPIGGSNRMSVVAQLADIPEEQIWLAKQKSARTRRAYKLDVQHFMATLGIESVEELRQADHKAVIAWERFMRESEHAASSTIRRRLAARVSNASCGGTKLSRSTTSITRVFTSSAKPRAARSRNSLWPISRCTAARSARLTAPGP
jgi:hypothetical protein